MDAATEPNTRVRQAGDGDVAALSAMGTRFVRASGYGQFALVPKEEIEIGLRAMLRDGAVCFVVEQFGKVVGAIVGAIVPLWFSPSTKVASELAWWVDEEHRKGLVGVRLIRAFEAWAEANGAQLIAMSDLVAPGDATNAAQLFEHFGYRMVERAFVRRV